ncbi:glycerate kinase [Pseudoclavibacter sp. 13-3]|uniref:glycerate kinase n=1 Tax=Pseudoclavibacter sp. 13-3 TaxID=2901228 RepID=UPI001E342532|nr:glycerate kinase [Pseudoclavibacter sp. 13-3]MCD7100773.1 glycerate kinase [Pseudoclavibacter sp. 13-3]
MHTRPASIDRALRVLVAPDKFKGSLRAAEAAQLIGQGIRTAVPDAQITLKPIADGGEGTVDAFLEAGATEHTAQVHGPLHDQGLVPARWATTGDTAVIELAQAAGLQLVPAAPGRDPGDRPAPDQALAANTRGVGELIRLALDEGYRSLVIGIGGSASTDGGFGCITELGLRVFDAQGHAVGDVRDLDRINPARGCGGMRLDTADLDPRLAETTIVIASDVTAPLAGAQGAAQVFGPQKGADADAMVTLQHRLALWGSLLEHQTGTDVQDVEGAGAAGGFSAPLIALRLAEVRSGGDEIADLLGISDALEHTDVAVVGEGSLDEQSLQGKGPVQLARRAAAAGATVVAIAGRSTLDDEQLARVGIRRLATLVEQAGTAERAMRDAAALLPQVAEEIFTTLDAQR